MLLYSGAGPMAGSLLIGPAGGWDPALALVANLLTAPIPTDGVADIRFVIFPATFAALALLAAFDLWRRSNAAPREPVDSGGNGKQKSDGRDDAALGGGLPFSMGHSGISPLRWMIASGLAVLLIAMLSAVANQSCLLSWGWIAQAGIGLLWACLVAVYFDVVMTRRVLTGLVTVGVIACSLALWHRMDRKFDLFTFPIGPVTPTATFAAIFAALAGGRAVGQWLSGSKRFEAVGLLGLAAAFTFVLVETERRGQLLALGATPIALGAFALWHRARSRRVRLLTVAVVLLSAAAGFAYVGRELLSANRVAAGSVGVRLEYWRLSLGMILDRPSLGSGPDTFVSEMTTAIAPLRGVSPHVYHGNIDPEAHNEWIQAAVELGAPGALFWLALPLGVLYLSCRGSGDAGSTAASKGPRDGGGVFGAAGVRPLKLSLAAAILVIVLAECSGIMMRGSMAPVWYWTLLGLLCATGREGFETSRVRHGPARRMKRRSRRASAFALLATAIGSVFLVNVELGGAGIDERLAASRTVENWRWSAELASARARERLDSRESAVEQWQRLYQWMPGYLDNCARYAEALHVNGVDALARLVLDQTLRRGLNAYEPGANLLFAELYTDDPRQKLLCVIRMLRHSAVDARVAAILKQISADADVREAIRQKLEAQTTSRSTEDDSTVDDDRAEWLRVRAWMESTGGRADAAIAAQREAAEIYRSLEQSNNRYRRGREAELDAFFALAEMLHLAGPEKLSEAFAAIVEAERFAVLGIAHERVSDPEPSRGYVGGEVVPTEFPERLRPMWRLSALLHVEAGDEWMLDARILSYLPPAELSDPNAIRRERQLLYRMAVRELGRLAPEKRPAYYGRLVEAASQ